MIRYDIPDEAERYLQEIVELEGNGKTAGQVLSDAISFFYGMYIETAWNDSKLLLDDGKTTREFDFRSELGYKTKPKKPQNVIPLQVEKIK